MTKNRESAHREERAGAPASGASQGRRLGLMGGTFDPIHLGHLLIGETALEELMLDQVVFMPSGFSYLKEGRIAAGREERYRMTLLAVEGNPHFSASRMEIDRPGRTYTAQTLRELHEQNPADQWFLLMGADSFLYLDHWVEPETICALSELVCAVRGDDDRERLLEKKEFLKERFGAVCHILTLGRMDISSSDIRKRLEEGRSVRYLLRDGVLRYIRETGLYTGGKTAEEKEM